MAKGMFDNELILPGVITEIVNDYVAGYLNQILEEEKARAEAYNEKMRLEAEARAAEEAAKTNSEDAENKEVDTKVVADNADDESNLDF